VSAELADDDVPLELPAHDETIARLAPELRARLAAMWETRASSELLVASAFATLVTQLFAVGADPIVLELATRATRDELRHAELCRVLAVAYRGAEVPAPRARRVELARYPDLDAGQVTALHVVNQCCISETVATAFVEVCLRACEGPLVRAIHRRHLSDEIVHARVGWAHLASGVIRPRDREAIAAHLEVLLAAQLGGWERRIGELPELGIAGHGYPPRAGLIETVRDAIATLVLPGLAYVGIDTSRGQAWLDQHPTSDATAR
jgi:hypothetical protein